MKLKLTIIIVLLYIAIMATWESMKSPVTGAVSATQLDDTLASYMAAKAMQQNLPEQIAAIALLLVLSVIWIYPSAKTNKK